MAWLVQSTNGMTAVPTVLAVFANVFGFLSVCVMNRVVGNHLSEVVVGFPFV